MTLSRFVTAASLFDGHDASINIMRRLLQRHGAEVVHLGHNRSVDEVVAAVVEEDPHGVAVSSYQGGHVEYFTYLVDRLRDEGYGHVKVYGGGGGVIVPSEIDALHAYGVTRIFSPAGRATSRSRRDDRRRCSRRATSRSRRSPVPFDGSHAALARAITCLEAGVAVDLPSAASATSRCSASPGPVARASRRSPTSSLNRLRRDQEDKLRVAVLAVDPTRRQGRRRTAR